MLAGGPSRIADSTFAVVANGASDGPPASALREFLVANGAARVTAVLHPLSAEDPPRHEIAVYERGAQVRRRSVRAPSRPPYTYPLDVAIPMRMQHVDGWFAFNNLVCARGLLARRARRAGRVVYWAVDFVPDRFGPGALTKVYDRLDRWCCRRADLRVEVSTAARAGRDQRHALVRTNSAPAHVAPIGAWLDRVATAPADGYKARRIVFIGHLVARMGVDVMVQALALLQQRGVEFVADVAGRGPLEAQLREQAAAAGLDGRLRFHGFIPDHRDLEALLGTGSVALAPYADVADSFTRFADPGKLKSYLAAGLPIITTDVSPTARELAQRAGAEVVDYDAHAFADAIERALASPQQWQERRAAALRYATGFDWNTILARALEAAGFVV